MALRFFSLFRLSALSLIIIFLASACKEDEPSNSKTTSQDVPGLTSFRFRSENNPAISHDIIFTKQPDNSFAAEVVHEVLLENFIPSFDYTGKVTMKNKTLVSDETSATFPDEFILHFDKRTVVFRITRYYTIPDLHINTENSVGVTSKTNYVKCAVHIDGKNMFKDFTTTTTDSAEIRGRGNSTWLFYNKKPYRIKLASKQELLGMGAGKSWVLLANYRDPTNFMNAIVFDMARYMQMPYTNANRFVEVYLDDDYIGMYQLTEQIQQGENRVAIDKDAGVLLNLDLDDGPSHSPGTGDNFNSTIYNLPIAIKHPENITPDQVSSIKTDFAALELLIKNRDMAALSKRLDIPSLIDFLIIQEITRNVELVSPRSMYVYKDADQIYHFGPVWDFDGGFAFDWASMTTGHGYFGSQSWLMGSSNPSKHPGDAYNYISGFFVNLFGNTEFVTAYKARWTEINSGMLKYCFEQLDDYTAHCKTAMAHNAKRWPIGKDYNAEIEKMKAWLTVRTTNYSSVVKNY